MTFVLEPYRRILVGASGGVLFGLALAYTLGLDRVGAGLIGALLAIAGGAAGGVLVARLFDVIVIGASAFGGVVMATSGAAMILPGLHPLDPAAGGVARRLTILVLAGIGVHWQLRHVNQWARSEPLLGNAAAKEASSRGQPKTF